MAAKTLDGSVCASLLKLLRLGFHRDLGWDGLGRVEPLYFMSFSSPCLSLYLFDVPPGKRANKNKNKNLYTNLIYFIIINFFF